ncbi:MAG: hypothetical protein Kow0042_02210 [Calditrichia bacterium]
MGMFPKLKREKESIESVLALLRIRGFRVKSYWYPEKFLPLMGIESARHFEIFYRLLKRYSARLLLHDLFSRPAGSPLENLMHYCSESGALQILQILEEIGLVEKRNNLFFLKMAEGVRIGDLLEWFTSVLLHKEFGVQTIFKVQLQGNKAGGDFDVLANLLGRLLFVEVKSAPPKGIHNPEIGEFLERVKNLLPDIAIFLNDTHLRVKDKIVLMFEEELIQRKGVKSLQELPILRVKEQIFHLNHYIYIMNSKRDLKRNFTVVFRDYINYNLPGRNIF